MSEKMTSPEPERIKAMSPEELFEQFERLIFKIVNRYANAIEQMGWIDIDDLRQVAAIALLKAQKSYDPQAEAAFVTYAYTVMRYDILRALKVRKTSGGYRLEPILMSLDEPIGEGEDDTRGDFIPSDEMPIDEQIERREIAVRVRSAVDELDEGEEEIIERLYLSDPIETREQIADEKGLSGEAVRQREKKALKHLRPKLADLKEFRPRHIGTREFNSTWTSEPELYVLTREKQLEQMEERYREYVKRTTGKDVD